MVFVVKVVGVVVCADTLVSLITLTVPSLFTTTGLPLGNVPLAIALNSPFCSPPITLSRCYPFTISLVADTAVPANTLGSPAVVLSVPSV